MVATSMLICFLLVALIPDCRSWTRGIVTHRGHSTFSPLQLQQRYKIGTSLRLLSERTSTSDTESFLPFENLQDAGEPSESSTESGSSAWFARISLLTVSAFYGTNFGCVKILGDVMDPSVAAALRFSLAAFIFAPFLMKHWNNKKLIQGGVEVGTYNALGYYAQAQALQTSSASTVAFICSLAVIVVPLLEMMFGKKDESVSKESVWYAPFIPALLATAGVACLELGGTDIPGVGDLWAFLQPLFFGLSFWRVEKHIHSAQEPGQPQAFTAAMMLAIAAGSCAWAAGSFVSPIVTGTHWGMESLDAVASSFNIVGHKIMTEGVAAEQVIWQSVQDWHVVAAIAWTGIVTTALTTFVENVAMKKLSASESTVIYSTEPLFGTAFAAIALHEHVGANTFVGAALIIAAMVWSTFGPLAISGVLAAASESFMNDQVEDELTENLGSNFVQIIQRLLQSNPEM